MTTQNDQPLRVGATMPDLTIPALDGEPFELSSLAGKKYIIYMWASW